MGYFQPEEGHPCQHLEGEEIRIGACADKLVMGRGSRKLEGFLCFLLKLEMRVSGETELGVIKLEVERSWEANFLNFLKD